MAKCDMCGNDYQRSFELKIEGRTFTFDSFECAIAKCAPQCAHCGCRIIGHGVESGATVYCCAQCARHAGVDTLRDHA